MHNCYYFLAIWMSAFPNRGIYHVGILFCRFIYIRYATGSFKQLRKSYEFCTDSTSNSLPLSNRVDQIQCEGLNQNIHDFTS